VFVFGKEVEDVLRSGFAGLSTIEFLVGELAMELLIAGQFFLTFLELKS
jgi:hypothetical protein